MAYRFLDDQESILGSLGRGAARTVARVGESVAGAPADIVSGVAGLGNLITQKVTGSELPGAQTVSQAVQPFTSQGIKENVTQKLTGDYLNPRGAGEAFVDQIVGDLGGLLAGGVGGLAKGGIKAAAKTVGKQALRATGANIAGRVAEDVTGSPTFGGLTKALTLLGSSTAGGRQALTQLQKESYQQAKQAIPVGAQINARTLGAQLDNSIKAVAKLDMPNKEFVLDRLQAVRRNIKNGRIGALEAFELRKNMNDYLYNQTLTGQQARYVSRIRDLLNDQLDSYGRLNPQFKQFIDVGDDITRGLKSGGQVQQFLNNNVRVGKILQNYKPLSFGLYGLVELLGKPYTLGALTAGVPSAFLSKYAGQTYNLIKTSPVARQYYQDIISASVKKDAAAFASAIKKFDQFAAKQTPAQESTGTRYQLLE